MFKFWVRERERAGDGVGRAAEERCSSWLHAKNLIQDDGGSGSLVFESPLIAPYKEDSKLEKQIIQVFNKIKWPSIFMYPHNMSRCR